MKNFVSDNTEVGKWAAETQQKLIRKLLPTASRNRDKVPFRSCDGVFDDYSAPDKIGWWTNGFWGGMMWQMFHLTGETIFREAALINEEKVRAVLMDYENMDHDSGFRFLLNAVAHYRHDHDDRAKDTGLLAASNLAGRYNPAGRFIRAWNDSGGEDRRGYAIIDCMMNLPLLYWASEVTSDPRFRMIAREHALTASEYFVREDGSVCHIVDFDCETGAFRRSLAGQGYAAGSSWSRGQAWAVYGFALSYRHTGDIRFLDTARKVADYCIASIPDSGLVPVDYRQPETVLLEDSSAAAITACGLIELAGYLEGAEADHYRGAAVFLLRTLDEKRCCWDPETDYLLEKCTSAYHDGEHEFSLIYGDYYFLEGILKLTGSEFFLW